MLSQKALNEIFTYDGRQLRWRHARGSKPAGGVAGCLQPHGYWRVRLNGKLWYAHRIIYAMHTGEWPDYVDHKNRDTTDNRISNLRSCSKSQNEWNQKLSARSTSGVKGVSYHKRSGLWCVEIRKNKKRYRLGGYQDIELAELVAMEAREKLHGEFARHA